MLEMNKVMLIGNLTRDPEISVKQSGVTLAKMGLAVGRKYKNKQTGEWVEETAFVDMDAWRNTADFCGKYLKKGTRVYVEGSLKFSSWEAQDGSKRSKLSVTADHVEFVLSKAQEESRTGGSQSPPSNLSPPPPYGPPPPDPDQSDMSDDLPF